MANDVRIRSSPVRQHLFGNVISTTTPPRNSTQTPRVPSGALPTAGSTTFGVFCQWVWGIFLSSLVQPSSALRQHSGPTDEVFCFFKVQSVWFFVFLFCTVRVFRSVEGLRVSYGHGVENFVQQLQSSV